MLRYNKKSATPLFSEQGQGAYTRLMEKANTKSRTDRYRFLDTADFVEALVHHMPVLDRDSVSIATKGKASTSTVHVIRVPSRETVVIGDTIVQPELVLRNSFAGEGTLLMNLGFYRQVCANGMMVGQSLIPQVTLRHVDGPKFNSGLDDFFFAAQTLLESDFKTLIENKLTLKKLTHTQTVHVIKSLPHVSERVKDLAVRVVRSKQYRIEDVTSQEQSAAFTAWNIWNIVNEAASASARDPNGPALVERESKLMDNVLAVFDRVA